MSDTKEKITDCEVCKRLIKEKHQYDFIWKIVCIIFVALTIIFAVLYFGGGTITTETEITVDNSIFENSGDNGNIVIGGEGGVLTGVIEQTDYTPIICISIIVGSVIVVLGGIVIAYNHKKDN